ncbi:hypothetical protein [Paraburkholderia strydomiana]
MSQASPKKPVGPANSTGYPGVYLHRPKHAAHRWVARVTINSKCKAVPGRYDSAEEAYAARVAFLAKIKSEKTAIVDEVA